ncbi:MAG: (2Fe-2S)-binding protein [Rhodocyclaceae bacterium]|nr:(2Fe-2S)-binding protein [Rhodocyclaceae bacterium]
MNEQTFNLDGQEIPFAAGQSVMQAALAAGVFVPHLCYHPEFRPHGSCKLCTMKINGRPATSCTTPAAAGMEVESDTPEILDTRRILLQMLLVEGNHFCPSCEKSGHCKLQALGYELGVMSPHFNHFYPDRPVDASHPDVLLDFNRCILCELCIRASAEVDKKNVFALSGRGIKKHLIVNAESGKLGDTDFALTDKAAQVCPVGVILAKRKGFAVPIGQRRFDAEPISAHVEEFKPIAAAAPRAGDKP